MYATISFDAVNSMLHNIIFPESYQNIKNPYYQIIIFPVCYQNIIFPVCYQNIL